jgi:hypothetical protein
MPYTLNVKWYFIGAETWSRGRSRVRRDSEAIPAAGDFFLDELPAAIPPCLLIAI